MHLVYGYPGPPLVDGHRRGEVLLGGCCVSDDDPEYGCRTCREADDF
jgi:hypothetical protein